MGVSIPVIDDEPDAGELFRQRFRRETRGGTYVMHFAESAAEALGSLSEGVTPPLIVFLSDINIRGWTVLRCCARSRGRGPTFR